MKKQFFTRITALMLAILMVVSICACSGAEVSSSFTTRPTTGTSATTGSTTPPPSNDGGAGEELPPADEIKIIDVEKNLYVSADQKTTFPAAYFENESEILLVEMESAVEEILNECVLKLSTSEPAGFEQTETTVTITRENGAYCEIDFEAGNIFFNDFDLFVKKDFKDNPHDMLAFPYVNENGESRYFKRESSFFTPGYGLEINLAERNIPFAIYEGKKYLPLQTFSDLFSNPFGFNFAYNGEDVFFIVGDALDPSLQDIYYLEERTLRSEALAEFNFNELCLYLDLYYGLKTEHGFNDGFDYYLETIGLKEKFLELDSVHSFNALATLTMGYIADLHSQIKQGSPYLGAATPPEEERDVNLSNDIKAAIKASGNYEGLRTQMLGEVEFYQKIGNTAYVTFDSFALGDRRGDYGEDALTIGDTITIIMLAHAQIMADEEIENVVLDLSCNGGGAFDAAVYVVAWMLGSCELSIYNSITESRATTNYTIDVNMDGIFDENDSIADKNIYCLISPVSFSCGNLVPALLQASGNATIIGKTSGGGGCAVSQGVTADGTIFCISSAYQISTVKNGTYYSVDKGINPDIVLTKDESFYDREGLTEFINGLK